MKPVSQKQKEQTGNRCFICGKIGVEMHHSLQYKNRQIHEITVALCAYHHRGNFGDIFQEVKLKCEKYTIQNNLEYLKKNYPKCNWEQRLKYLCQKVKS